MSGYLLPITSDPWQICTIDVVIDGEEFHAQVEVRFLNKANCWVLSIWDHATGELLVNMIPLICSYVTKNDLLLPFRYLREGKGMGSLLCIRGTDEPSSVDPGENNLTEFQIVWCDTFTDL